jgi:hypothetical protein
MTVLLVDRLKVDLKTSKLPKRELLSLMKSLRMQKLQEKDLWQLLMQQFVVNLNSRQLSCWELCNATYDLHQLKMRSAKLFEIIVLYFEKMGFTS